MPLGLRCALREAIEQDRKHACLHQPVHAVLVVRKVEHTAKGLTSGLCMLRSMDQCSALYLIPDALGVHSS